jgi:predicted nuclease of predicted toxin-antitoxin system
LREKGHDVLFVGDVMPGSSDEEVLASAESDGRILITDDKDFGQLIFRLGRPTSGVILLRLPSADVHKRSKILLDIIEKQDIEGKFVTVRENRIKITKPR